MTEHAKNLMVGLTVIAAMALLGWMIILFTGLPTLLKSGYEVRVRMDARSEVNVGDQVHLEGMEAGSVSDISFTDPNAPYEGITLTVLVNSEITLPSNTVLWVTKRTLGRPWIEFFAEGDPPPGGPPNLSKLKPDTIAGHSKESSLLPAELTPALNGLAKLADNLNELLAPESQPGSAAGTTTSPSTRPGSGGLAATLDNLNATLTGLANTFGDVENQANIKAALKGMARTFADADNQANIKSSLAKLASAADKADKAMDAMKAFADETRKAFVEAAGSANAVGKRVDGLALKLIEDAEKISTLLSTTTASP